MAQDRQRARISGRRPRMSEAQTREAALRTAVEAIREDGLAVSLEHLSMEDVIREAGVSRTAFYRLWPLKDQFIGDLIVELAKDAIPVQNTRGADATQQLSAILLPRMDALKDERVRWQTARELITEAAISDFVRTAETVTQWRTYFALVTFVMSLPEGDARDAARREIGRSEARYRARLVSNFQMIAGIFAVRLRTESGVTFDEIVELVIATVRGLVLRSQVGEPPMDHSLVALSMTAIITCYFENDPAVVWDDDRMNRLRAMLSASVDIFTPSDPTAGQSSADQGER